jgi:RNA polymerase sigma-70 factor (ECF subfamily)
MLKQEESRVGLLDEGSFGIELAFQAIVKHLSPLQRTVFLLRDVLSYSITETAELLETSEGAIKAALHRARHSLNAVKDDLEKGTLPAPKEEGLKSFLRALANAYRVGDLTTLIELAQRDEIEPAAAIGIVQHEIRARTSMMQSDFQSRSYWAVMMSA